MKPTIIILLISSCLFGQSPAAPDRERPDDKPNVRAEASKHDGRNVDRPNHEDYRRARRDSNAEAKPHEDAKRNAPTRKAMRNQGNEQARGGAEKMGDEHMKATADKKAAFEKRGEEMLRLTKELMAQRERAHADCRKAAEALSEAEMKRAAVDAKLKAMGHEQASRSAAVRRHTEFATTRKQHEIASKDKAMMREMQSDIDSLERQLIRVIQMLEKLQSAADTKAKN